MNWWSSIVLIDLPRAMAFECVFPVGFFASLLVRTLLPLVLMLLLAAAGWVLRTKNPAANGELAALCSSGWFYLLFLGLRPVIEVGTLAPADTLLC
jgi:hypothetical protein